MSPCLPALVRRALEDLDTVCDRDPSVRSRPEALLHPAITAVWVYRIAHQLYRSGRRIPAQALTGLAKMATGGIEIHAGATIGTGFFVDHGAGVVIGETAVIGNDVTIFHQVTLGSIGWWHDRNRLDGSRRHPQVGNRVVIGAGATILGPVSVGDDCVVGAQALVLTDVPPASRVLAPQARVEPRSSKEVTMLPLDFAERRLGSWGSKEIPNWTIGC